MPGKTGAGYLRGECFRLCTTSNDVLTRTLPLITNLWCFSKDLDSNCPVGSLLVAQRSFRIPKHIN